MFSAYGECCIDDVTASHASANDLIVHFGHSCLSTDQSMEVVTAESKDRNAEKKQKNIVYMLPNANKIISENKNIIQETATKLVKQIEEEYSSTSQI